MSGCSGLLWVNRRVVDLSGPTGVIENGHKALLYSSKRSRGNISGVLERGPPGARFPESERANYTIIILVKNGRSLIVQSEDIPVMDARLTMAIDIEDMIANIRTREALLSQRLSVVASLIDTIDFDKSQFAVLVSDAQQTRLVTQPSDDIPPLTAPLGWLPRVQESDLYVCQWSYDKVHCIWNGRQVDFFTTFSIADRWRVQQMITITHLLEELNINITYEPLAIVVRGTEILGLIMARVTGRYLEMRDRSLVYSTFAQLHEANIMLETRPSAECFLIHQGKLCLTQCVPCLVQYEPGDKVRDCLEAGSWQALDELFDKLPQLDTSLIGDVNKCLYKPTLLNYIATPEPLIFHITWTYLVPEIYQKNASRKKKAHFSKLLLKSDTSGHTRYKPANSLSKSTYHPYSDGLENYTLPFSNQSQIHPSDKHNRRKASGVLVRAVSVASDHTLVDVDDDATTVIGDDERWKS
ncbi:hypothetical protein EV359DRAFT_62523 [Lentinula novae-zelandiae]|nr:hypothetical protein EV359DRAFT_62523 [Lentinula novae-zelandiae]